ncbi:hypothetical protein MBAV_000358 [Candidatus Magnetobacterium bavaricum]|uniref:Uncharacterized protein n=1 Tax=Candidatus Magnetobacterium bavaricum TaxID=29290 RepID=A0A0F3H3E7_9BACT|nr:hypothetical protein MBAV_000358 [Candidatus Magnetobacterium bavaricum]
MTKEPKVLSSQVGYSDFIRIRHRGVELILIDESHRGMAESWSGKGSKILTFDELWGILGEKVVHDSAV